MVILPLIIIGSGIVAATALAKKGKAAYDLTFELQSVKWKGISLKEGSVKLDLTFNLYNKHETDVKLSDFDVEITAYNTKLETKDIENKVRLGRMTNPETTIMKAKTNNKLTVNASLDIKRLVLNYANILVKWIDKKPDIIETVGSFKIEGVQIPYDEKYNL